MNAEIDLQMFERFACSSLFWQTTEINNILFSKETTKIIF